MMLKLSLTSVKKRWQDYLVLMMGLIISIAIFYMFQTLSLNTKFLEENIPTVAMVTIVFQLGAFLLAIITVVYIFYANSFLLSMRKKEYGMYMMLGAKKRKIGQMIAIETLFIGACSLLIGTVIGTLLAKVMGSTLSQLIDLPSNTYESFVPLALLVTSLFFVILFIVTSIINVVKFRKTSTLDLLYSEAKSERSKKQPVRTAVKILLSLILIGIGYGCMINMSTLQIIGVFIAIITITPGTFLFFNALVPFVVNQVKSSRAVSNKGIRIFTLSQLSFKATSLARVLGLVSMLLALSLGAVTVGQAFRNFAGDVLKSTPNDVVIYNPTAELNKQVSQLNIEEKLVYHTKNKEGVTYFIQEDFAKQPLKVTEYNGSEVTFTPNIHEVSKFDETHVYSVANDDDFNLIQGLSNLLNPYITSNIGVYDSQFQIIPKSNFESLEVKEELVQVIRVKDYQKQANIFKKIDQLEKQRFNTTDFTMSKYDIYQQIQSMASGFMFMGFFLGIAFLAMLASCLMFKILSGAYQDVKRYDMLHKIGVRRNLLIKSLHQELFAIFLAPAVLGIVHVLVGLKMFTVFIPNPYNYIALPFAVYGAIYLIYYVITAQLYKNIVLPKK
ncbi:FtsX-like permease family protein [Vagococcus intermedius]|uniref:ABC transporter permease n=1 Tax=Vagococcus intermedius TaxID=2991418 RepID=A0AAF0CTY4_9ENTE|nr:ABC transporter permease [Vagococcus intermedius]WEG72667.1 ABC transporter permease [Vagococcus intermedius]WEG74752.1 ABC transporter permease [Vagococcus intermedius]